MNCEKRIQSPIIAIEQTKKHHLPQTKTKTSCKIWRHFSFLSYSQDRVKNQMQIHQQSCSSPEVDKLVFRTNPACHLFQYGMWAKIFIFSKCCKKYDKGKDGNRSHVWLQSLKYLLSPSRRICWLQSILNKKGYRAVWFSVIPGKLHVYSDSAFLLVTLGWLNLAVSYMKVNGEGGLKTITCN